MMLIQAILSVFFKLVDGILSKLPEINIEIPATVVTDAAEFFRVVAYIVPMDTVAQILMLIVALQGFRIAVSLIKTIWNLLPIV